MIALDLVIRALVLLGLAWTTTVLLRRRAAALRALVWTTAMAALIALPLLIPVAPDWRIEWTATVAPATPTTIAAPSTQPMTAPDAAAVDVAPAARPIADRPAFASAPDRSPDRSIDWRQAIAALTMFVAGLLVLRLAIAHIRVARLARAAVPLGEASWRLALQDAGREVGLRRSVAVRVSEAVGIPAVAGVLRPTLLLPADAQEWAPDLRRTVLLHELAHVARRDALAQLVGRLACAMYWYLPPVWRAARRAAALREQAADDAVIRAGVAPAAYAQRLLHLARGAAGADAPTAALAMAQPTHLRARVLAILDPAASRAATGVRGSATIAAAALALATAVAAAKPAILQAQPSPSETRHDPAVPPTPAHTSAQAAPPVASSPQTPTTAGPRLCRGGIDSSSTQARSDNGVRTWRVELRGDDCRVDLRAEGRIDFTPDFSDVSAIAPGGFFRVDISDGGDRRQLDIEPRNGTLTRTWRVGGREQPYDDAARAWFAAVLIELDRRTAIGVDVRLPYLLTQGGVAAVLDETARMSGDHPRGRYYAALARTTTLSAAEATRVLQQAASLTQSDHYALQVLRAFAGRGLDGDPRQAAIQVIEAMDSDYYRAEALEALVGAGRPNAANVDLLVRMIPRMSSDHYQLEALRHVVRAGGLTPAQQAALARAAAAMESDHYLAEFLGLLAAAGADTGVLQPAIFETARGIQSDHYLSQVLRTLIRSAGAGGVDAGGVVNVAASLESDHYREEVLETLLALPQLTEADLLGVVNSAAPMSDHYESSTLRRVLAHRAATERVRTAVFDAASRLSKHYADAVRRGR